MTSIRTERLAKILSLFWLSATILLYALYPPYWALMDDVANLGYVREWSHMGWLTSICNYVQHDVTSWGIFRPLYPLFVVVFYTPLQQHPGLAYAILAVLMFGLWWVCALLFEKLTDTRPAGGRWWFFLIACLFTPNFNLLLFASLQEKFILFCAAGYSWIMLRW